MAFRSSGMSGGHSQLDQLMSQQAAYRQNQNMIRVHVFSLMSATNICRMTPKMGDHMDNFGNSNKLLFLDGTVTILYKGAQFYIPVQIWIPFKYPQAAPIVYVCPTKDMMIKPNHQHVGNDGMVYIPYISQWNPRHSSLVDAVKHCSTVFGNEPPVYKKPTNQPPPQRILSQPAMYTHQQQQFNQPQAAAQSTPQITYDPQTGQPIRHQTTPAVTYDPNTGLPIQRSMAGAAATVTAAVGMQMNNGTYLHSQSSPPAYSQNAPPPAYGDALRSSTGSYGSDNAMAKAVAQTNKGGLSEKEQLIEALSGQIQQQLEKFSRECTDEMDVAFNNQMKLEESSVHIKASLESMENIKNKLSQAATETEEKAVVLEEWLTKQLSEGETINVDKILVPADNRSKQMFEAVAEDAAIDDAIYFMEKAFNRGSINLTDYMKEVRNLAEEQFMVRALSRKVYDLQK